MNGRWFAERFGIALGVLGALVIGLAVLPGNAERTAVDTGFGDTAASGGDPFAAASGDDPFTAATAAASSGGGTAGVTNSQTGASTSASAQSGAVAAPGQTTAAAPTAPAGTGGAAPAPPDPSAPGAEPTGPTVQFGVGPNCRPDGRQNGIGAYMAPCVQWTGTDNGGATFRGVTEDEILIVNWRAQSDPGTQAILAGARLADTTAVVERAMNTLVKYWNEHAELYGRQVRVIHVDASGPSTSEEAMRADALKIAEDIKPFAVLPATDVPVILARELALRGVVCMCTTSRTSAFYTELPPLLFMEYPTADEYAAHAAEYIGKKLEGKPAQYAGDDQTVGQTFTTSERKYGIIYINGSQGTIDPDLERSKDVMVRELNKVGVSNDRIESIGYVYDPGRNQTDMTNMIAKMKGAGVTTIIPFWDPLTPIILTQEATRQQYFPEWFNIGLGLSDTTTAARLYDQSQWQNAFGITPLWVTWETVENSIGYREFHHGCPDCNPGDEGTLINIYRERPETFFNGLQMAGPNLTNETFVNGMFDLPPTGGTAGLPLQFFTRQFPGEIKDFAEFWYDVDSTGPDERGDIGPGVIWKANNGARYRLGSWTTEPSLAFVRENVLAVSNDPPGGGDYPHEADGHTHP